MDDVDEENKANQGSPSPLMALRKESIFAVAGLEQRSQVKVDEERNLQKE